MSNERFTPAQMQRRPVLLSDMVDNSNLPIRLDSRPFSRRSSTHDHPHAG